MWSMPYCILLLCLGIFFWIRTRKALSELPQKMTLGAFFWEYCSAEQRRTIAATALRLFSGSGAVQTLLVLAMLKAGGAGCLVWYALFSLLWLHPVAAFETLRHYYGPGEGSRMALLLKGRAKRRGVPEHPRLAQLLGLLELSALLGGVLIIPQLWSTLPVGTDMLPLLVLAGAGGCVCFFGGRSFRAGAALLFLLFLAVGLLTNWANLFPVLKIIFLDAFQKSRAVFALSGAGLAAAIRSGMQLGAAAAVGPGSTAFRGKGSDEHPVYHGFQMQICALAQLAVQLMVGVLFLCSALAPKGNEWFQSGLPLFLLLFCALFCTDVLKLLAVWKRRRQVLLGAVLAAGALFWSLLGGGTDLLPLFWGVCNLSSIAVAGLLLADESWYILLLEHYRDRWIWHINPYPDLVPDNTKM